MTDINEVAKELSYRYAMLKEQAIWRYLRMLQSFPSPMECAAMGMFVRCSAGDDSYEEFRWRDKPIFQIRIVWDDYKIRIEVTDLWQKES